jgi:hypothetical protein
MTTAQRPTPVQAEVLRKYAGLPHQPFDAFPRKAIASCIERGWLTKLNHDPFYVTTSRGRAVIPDDASTTAA